MNELFPHIGKNNKRINILNSRHLCYPLDVQVLQVRINRISVVISGALLSNGIWLSPNIMKSTSTLADSEFHLCDCCVEVILSQRIGGCGSAGSVILQSQLLNRSTDVLTSQRLPVIIHCAQSGVR